MPSAWLDFQTINDNRLHGSDIISNILFEDKEFIMMGDVNANVLSKPLDNDAKYIKIYMT